VHSLVADGMADNAASAAKCGPAYYPDLETGPRGGKGLLEALAAEACAVVIDEFP
jgi:deoxyribodipyrimidine photo-lyase